MIVSIPAKSKRLYHCEVCAIWRDNCQLDHRHRELCPDCGVEMRWRVAPTAVTKLLAPAGGS